LLLILLNENGGANEVEEVSETIQLRTVSLIIRKAFLAEFWDLGRGWICGTGRRRSDTVLD